MLEHFLSCTRFSGILNTILGVPSECVHQNNVWPCKLSFSCWLQGGRHAKGCGANKWLFSCCIGSAANTNTGPHNGGPVTAVQVQYGPYQGNSDQAPVVNLVGDTLNEYKRLPGSGIGGVGGAGLGIGGGGVLPKRVMLKRRNENDVYAKVRMAECPYLSILLIRFNLVHSFSARMRVATG